MDKPTRTILRRINRAIYDYQMIEEGDRILIALSGGKDSITLCKALQERKQVIQHNYVVQAVHVHTDVYSLEEKHLTWLEHFLEHLGIPLHHRYIQLKNDAEDRSLSCFWCSWNRRKTIFETAAELGCKKVAFGHHLDDHAETFLMNALYHGKLEGMDARLSFFQGEIIVIRPLIYLPEKDIRGYISKMKYPTPDDSNECHLAKQSKRQMIKTFLAQFSARDKSQILKNIQKLSRN